MTSHYKVQITFDSPFDDMNADKMLELVEGYLLADNIDVNCERQEYVIDGTES